MAVGSFHFLPRTAADEENKILWIAGTREVFKKPGAGCSDWLIPRTFFFRIKLLATCPVYIRDSKSEERFAKPKEHVSQLLSRIAGPVWKLSAP
jgi:hypothetical protein